MISDVIINTVANLAYHSNSAATKLEQPALGAIRVQSTMIADRETMSELQIRDSVLPPVFELT